jgi:hypothetical protein
MSSTVVKTPGALRPNDDLALGGPDQDHLMRVEPLTPDVRYREALSVARHACGLVAREAPELSVHDQATRARELLERLGVLEVLQAGHP